MPKVIVNEFMTLDGVAQAPGAADEDTTGGFEHGGWHLRYFDDLSQKWVVEGVEAESEDAIRETLARDPWSETHLNVDSIESWTIRLDGRHH